MSAIWVYMRSIEQIKDHPPDKGGEGHMKGGEYTMTYCVIEY